MRAKKGWVGWNPKGEKQKVYQRIMENIRVAKKETEKNIIVNMEKLDKILSNQEEQKNEMKVMN